MRSSNKARKPASLAAMLCAWFAAGLVCTLSTGVASASSETAHGEPASPPADGAPQGGDDHAHGAKDHGYSDRPIPLREDLVPDRPKPLLELGDPFLGTGPIGEGFTLPTGAVWQPSFLLFGTYRTAIQTFNTGDETFSEWAQRLDLFGNLQLSGTERVLIGIRPLDQNGNFTGYYFEPDGARLDEWESELNARITHLFFEGEFGEIFPSLDPGDSKELDLGFSVGRQPLFYQEGMLINDRVDSVGITKNNILLPGLTNLQMTLLYGWNEIHPGNNRPGRFNSENKSSHLFGFFSEIETRKTTLNFDVVYVYDDDQDDALYLAASAVQRFGQVNTASTLR